MESSLSGLVALATTIGAGYNVNSTTQAKLDYWLTSQPSVGYLVTSYKNEVAHWAGGSLKTGTLHVVLTAITSDGNLGTDTITIDSTTSGSNPDNGVRESNNNVKFATQSFATYQNWLLAAEKPANGFAATKLVPSEILMFTGTGGTLTLGPNQTFGNGGTSGNPGTAYSSWVSADINAPLSFFLQLTWTTKTP